MGIFTILGYKMIGKVGKHRWGEGNKKINF
jgi:hypothetical protein